MQRPVNAGSQYDPKTLPPVPGGPAPLPAPIVPQPQGGVRGSPAQGALPAGGEDGGGFDASLGLPPDLIGDFPPPPIPAPPPQAGGMPGGLGMGGAVRGGPAAPPMRFGPGVPSVGGSDALGLGNPNDIAELLRRLAANRTPPQG